MLCLVKIIIKTKMETHSANVYYFAMFIFLFVFNFHFLQIRSNQKLTRFDKISIKSLEITLNKLLKVLLHRLVLNTVQSEIIQF